MPLITEPFDSLPYVDAEPSAQERAKAQALISSALAPEAQQSLHPSIPEAYEPKFSPIIIAELERVAASGKLSAVDTSRYEALDAPDETDTSPETAAKWNDTLRKAYTAHAHLRHRQGNLAALDKDGKNAWLLGNYFLEHELKAIEKELAEKKEAIENVNKERKGTQDAVKGEMEGLETTWRAGIGRALEVEVANESLRKQILDAQRKAAQG